MVRFVIQYRRPIVVFSGSMLLVSVLLTLFLWLGSPRWSAVPWHFAILGGLTAGLLAAVTDGRVRTMPPRPTAPLRGSIVPIGQVLLAGYAAGTLQRIFPETITDLGHIGVYMVISGLYFGLWYARHHLARVHAPVNHRRALVRRFSLRAVQSLLWTVFALEASLLLVNGIHLKAPCSALDLPRRRQGCVVAFDQASYPWELQISEDGSLVVTTDANDGIYIWSPAQRALVRRLERTKYRVASLALSPDQQIIAAGYRDGTIQLWRIADGRVLQTFAAHADRVNALAFAPDGQTLASASDDRTARLWRVGSDQPLQTLDHADSVHHVGFMPDGASLITAHYKTLRVWDVQRGTVTHTLALPDDAASIAVSPDGKIIATGLYDGSVRLWRSSQESSQTLVESGDPVDVLAFSPNGRQLVTSYRDGARIWQVADATLLHTMVLDDHIATARFTPQHLLLMTNGLETVYMWRPS